MGIPHSFQLPTLSDTLPILSSELIAKGDLESARVLPAPAAFTKPPRIETDALFDA
jgi:hypothetical protein